MTEEDLARVADVLDNKQQAVTYNASMATKTAAPARRSAEERRESILEAAMVEFAAKGLHGTSTEGIAKRAGISQPHVFRLFGTKKTLFAEACRRCMRDVREAMAAAAAGKSGEEALDAISAGLRRTARRRPASAHAPDAHAATDEPEVRRVARSGYGELVRFVEQASGESKRVTHPFARGC